MQTVESYVGVVEKGIEIGGAVVRRKVKDKKISDEKVIGMTAEVKLSGADRDAVVLEFDKFFKHLKEVVDQMG
jgi:hypothetical protein